jgi:hypothetical protein
LAPYPIFLTENSKFRVAMEQVREHGNGLDLVSVRDNHMPLIHVSILRRERLHYLDWGLKLMINYCTKAQ